MTPTARRALGWIAAADRRLVGPSGSQQNAASAAATHARFPRCWRCTRPSPVSGRPRSARAHHAILEATLRLLVEQGYDGMSMEAVASVAGVGKPTIYRRYATKRELVVAAVSSLAESIPTPPGTGHVGADLLGYLEQAFGVFQRGVGFAMLGALLVKERDDPELMALFRARVVRPRMQVLIQILERGVVADQVRHDVNGELVAHMLAGDSSPPTWPASGSMPGWLQRVVDSLLEGLRPARPGR